MAFDVYPTSAPIAVPAGKDSDPISFAARIGPDPPLGPIDPAGPLTIFLRIVKLGDGNETHAGLLVSADTGVFLEVPKFPFPLPIFNDAGVKVGEADVQDETSGVSLLRIRLAIMNDAPVEVRSWRLKIRNKDNATRKFTFVVADIRKDTKQPWIDMTSVHEFDVVTGQEAVTRDFQIANNGTGQLRLDDAGVTELGAGFSLTTPTVPLEPNTSVVSQVKFVAPETPGLAAATFIFTSNDTAAKLTEGHNRRLLLSAIVRKPLWSPGDILVVDPNASDGASRGWLIRVDPVSGAQTLVRGGQLFKSPNCVAIDSDGNAVISDGSAFGGKGGVIRVHRLTGEQTKVSSEGSFEDPAGLVVLPDTAKTIVVVDQRGLGGGGGLIRVDPVSGQQTILAKGDKFGVPIGVAREKTGNLVVLDSSPAGQANAGIIRVSPAGAQTLIASGITQTPRGIAVAADGKILVTVSGPAALIRIDPNGGQPQQLATGQPMNSPSRVALDANGNAVVTDVGLRGVVRVAAGGGQTKLSTAGLLQSPIGIAVVPDL